MSNKFIFDFDCQDRKRALPKKLIIGQRENESTRHVLLKLLGFLLFHRERLQIEGDVHNDSIPYEPDLVQLDYTLRPALWIECGDCGVQKLHKLAVKVPDAEIWILKTSQSEAMNLVDAMAKGELRKNRYKLIGFDSSMMEELVGLVRARNGLTWVKGEFDPAHLQFDFNGLWFDHTFTILTH